MKQMELGREIINGACETTEELTIIRDKGTLLLCRVGDNIFVSSLYSDEHGNFYVDDINNKRIYKIENIDEAHEIIV